MNESLQRFFINNGHYGLIRDASEPAFKAANPYTLGDVLPEVDYNVLPESMRVAEWMNVENQGSVGSCQGHARTSAEELAIYRETKAKPPELNRMFAYITSQKIDNIRGDMGSTISGGAKASQQFGSCLEILWPYSGRYNTAIPQDCYDDAAKRKLRTWQALPNYEAVMRWLVHGIGGVVIGIGWNRSCEPDAQGRITNWNRGGGGHSLALLDWNRKIQDRDGKPFVCMLNSWGKQWGINGWAYIAPDVIDEWCDSESVIGYSDMDGEAITPRGFDWVKDSFFA